MSLREVSRSKSHGGHVIKYAHTSSALGNTEAKFSVFLPPQAAAAKSKSLPVVLCLAGLTCTEDNFVQKSGAQRRAAQLGLALVCPDTSPRGTDIDGEHESWDFGSGAGFYVDATESKWSKNYKMYSYVVEELPSILAKEIPALDLSRTSLTGHSMGGHGALTIFLKNPGKYKSATAFAPIANPVNCKWGHKAFSGYLGSENKDKWVEHDATELVKRLNKDGSPLNWLIDQGSEDQFLKDGQLLPDALVKAVNDSGRSEQLRYRLQDGYDHSYYFISTFIEDHLDHHAKYLL